MNNKFKSQDELTVNKNDEAYIIKYKDILYYGNEIVVDVINVCKNEFVTFEDILNKISEQYNISKEEIRSDINELVLDLTKNNILIKED